MSASSRPSWGSDFESLLPILTTRAGRSMVPSTAGRPVNGCTGPVQPMMDVVVATPIVVVVEASTVAASPPADVSVTTPGSVLVVTISAVVAGARVPSVGAGAACSPPPHPTASTERAATARTDSRQPGRRSPRIMFSALPQRIDAHLDRRMRCRRDIGPAIRLQQPET